MATVDSAASSLDRPPRKQRPARELSPVAGSMSTISRTPEDIAEIAERYGVELLPE